ncbi:MAG: NAD-dependent epimerase/dehydratase family protein [Alphaproteobacteria bacterium]|nr:NAD-dependent epimerase/dehydratase family protein [Alphaproteobacteria bacterium]
MSVRRVCLIGAGSIAHTHAEALSTIPGVSLHAVVDVNADAARKFAERWHIPQTFPSVTAALAENALDCAHVLVPPPLHRAAAEPILDAGYPVLVEKPMATSSEDCAALNDLASHRGTLVGVNQNYIYSPTFLRLRQLVETRKLGRLLAVQALYSMPLRQLSARQFGHWMFQDRTNILLEQAVHPLSQLAALVGGITDITASAAPPITISPGRLFFAETSITLRGTIAGAQLHFAVGRSFPAQTIVAICDDGIAVADVLNGRLATQARTKWVDPIDLVASGLRTGAAYASESIAAFMGYALGLAKIRPRSDSFFGGMRGSIAAFHAALDRGERPESDGAFGAALVDACERVAAAAYGGRPAVAAKPASIGAAPAKTEVALLGGTGFIGARTVRHLVDAGMTVTVAARNMANLPPEFYADGVRLVQADMRRTADVEKAIAGSPVVVNLAHGGGGSNRQEVEQAVVGSAREVAEACLRLGTKRLVHVGSIAALYLGNGKDAITGATPVDPQLDARADYSRAKALADRMLLELHANRALPVCILRPGVVVGAGSSPFHSGIGSFNNDQHCLGWNAGLNPLPFVLVEDIATAIHGAIARPEVDGKCYNLVGDVRLSAREYIAELARAMQRPLRYHPQSIAKLFAIELEKWLIKVAVGRAAAFPSMRDIRSRGMPATFDCSDAKRDLGWVPVSDRTIFIARAIDVHAPS